MLCMKSSAKKEIFSALFIPLLFLLVMWVVKLIELQFDLSFIQFGVLPQKMKGIKGIFLSPFIHKDLMHLFNNSYPILILGGVLFSAYRKIAVQIFIWLFLISGFWLWIIGRSSFHIGASGIIYALASFLFVSGIVRKSPRLTAVSLAISFLYGSMIWGIFPNATQVSWEGHLSGFVAGILVAIFFRNEGPQRKKYQWEIEEELEKDALEGDCPKVNYILTKKREA